MFWKDWIVVQNGDYIASWEEKKVWLVVCLYRRNGAYWAQEHLGLCGSELVSCIQKLYVHDASRANSASLCFMPGNRSASLKSTSNLLLFWSQSSFYLSSNEQDKNKHVILGLEPERSEKAALGPETMLIYLS